MNANKLPQQESQRRLIRRKEVEKLTGLGRSCIYARMSRNEFPKAIPIGGRLVAWNSEEIQKWIDDRITEANMPTVV